MAVQNAIGKGNFKILVSKLHKKSAAYKSEEKNFWKVFVKTPVFSRIVRRFFQKWLVESAFYG